MRRLLPLRWATASVLGFAAGALLVHEAHGGHPRVLRVALGTVELAGAALFAFPATLRIGALLLLVSLATAAAVHGAMGELPPLAFVVYAAAIWTVLHEDRRARSSP